MNAHDYCRYYAYKSMTDNNYFVQLVIYTVSTE